MSACVDAFDARPGGIFKITLTYRGDHSIAGKSSADTDIVEGRFVEFIPNERVVQLVTFQSDDPQFSGEMRMTRSLSAAHGGADVSIVAENVPTGISNEDHDFGLRSTLDHLARFVETKG